MLKPEKYYTISLRTEKLGKPLHEELDESEIFILRML
jgi:hypothetical protein